MKWTGLELFGEGLRTVPREAQNPQGHAQMVKKASPRAERLGRT